MPQRNSDIFAVIRHPARIWAVAAVHGERQRLTALHDALGARLKGGDRLVYLGNFLGHGVDPAGAVDELLNFRRYALTLRGAEPSDVVYLRGAQEEIWQKLLQLQFAFEPGEVLRWMLRQGVAATLRTYGGSVDEASRRMGEGVVQITRWTNGLREAMHRRLGHDELLSSLRRYAISDDGRLLFVSAGLDPQRPLSEQRDTFWWGADAFGAIDGPVDDYRLIVRGFDPKHAGLVERPGTLSLDAGSGFGGMLNAVCLAPDGTLLERIEV